MHRAVRRQSSAGISFMTSFYIHTLRRSGRRLARGERFLRTPGTGAYLTTRPGRGGGTTKASLANGIPHLVLQPRWGGFIFLAGRITQGFAKSAHPWLISSHPSGVEEQLQLRTGLCREIRGKSFDGPWLRGRRAASVERGASTSSGRQREIKGRALVQ